MRIDSYADCWLTFARERSSARMSRTSAMNSASREPRSRSIASLTLGLVLMGPGVKRNLSFMKVAPVAQISNLLYRGLPACQRVEGQGVVAKDERPADWKSAIQQIGNLRYLGAASSLHRQ